MGTGFSSNSSCLERGHCNDLRWEINTVPVTNYWKECCVDVYVALPLIVLITYMCTAATEQCTDMGQETVVLMQRFSSQEKIKIKLGEKSFDDVILNCPNSKSIPLSHLENLLSPCEGQIYSISLSGTSHKQNWLHIELRLIKTVSHCSFSFPRIDIWQGNVL